MVRQQHGEEVVTRSKESKRALSYARRMITKGTWKVHSRIPSMESIAETIGVSRPTVRKAIRVLEDEGTIENYGPLGFIVISDKLAKLKIKSKNRYYLHVMKNNLKILDVLNGGGKQIGRYVIKYIPASRNIVSIDVVSGTTQKASLSEIENTVNNPIDIKNLLRIYTKESDVYRVKRKKYDEQKKIHTLAHVVSRHKKELGIHG